MTGGNGDVSTRAHIRNGAQENHIKGQSMSPNYNQSKRLAETSGPDSASGSLKGLREGRKLEGSHLSQLQFSSSNVAHKYKHMLLVPFLTYWLLTTNSKISTRTNRFCSNDFFPQN